jgi:hypothetical protein
MGLDRRVRGPVAAVALGPAAVGKEALGVGRGVGGVRILAEVAGVESEGEQGKAGTRVATPGAGDAPSREGRRQRCQEEIVRDRWELGR